MDGLCYFNGFIQAHFKIPLSSKITNAELLYKQTALALNVTEPAAVMVKYFCQKTRD